jgi:hypothetical protein
MKVSRINDHLQAYQIAMHNAVKQREAAYRNHEEKKHLDRIEETRVQRARRLDLDKGQNIDIDC